VEALMGTVNRTIENDQQKAMVIRLIENREFPFTLSLTDGKHRSTAQNRLQMLWMKEIAEQRGDMTPAEVRAYCKLTIGVPILRDDNEAFRIRYDEILKPMPYEHKMKIMGEPIDLPVTRLMTTAQKTKYLDGIIRHFSEQGIILTLPDDHIQESGSSAPLEPVPADDRPPSVSAAPDDAAPSPSSGAPSSVDLEWLRNVVRMLWAATNYRGDIGVLKAQKVAALASYPKPDGCSEIVTRKAEAAYGYCRQIVLGELEKSDGLAMVAGVVGCDQHEIGCGNG
jgi:hypothetical protein